MSIFAKPTDHAWVFSMAGDGWALSLENIAAVVQMNACQDCTEVEQQNLTFIFQDISTNNVFMYMPALTAPDETFLNKIANFIKKKIVGRV